MSWLPFKRKHYFINENATFPPQTRVACKTSWKNICLSPRGCPEQAQCLLESGNWQGTFHSLAALLALEQTGKPWLRSLSRPSSFPGFFLKTQQVSLQNRIWCPGCCILWCGHSLPNVPLLRNADAPVQQKQVRQTNTRDTMLLNWLLFTSPRKINSFGNLL